ncbi:MAG: hypothetical protein UW46_C0001G0137 [Candidatus Yanofskybacteria bacterium GW2011_GWF1_44_227]|uniref:Uncharacterized protein n=1 Tax=Candidatus Yanofskybacteria bacterium GW2011_GWE2_40_11 TaxID=1619033 RepID=A0A0G0QM27_9BACT|nr:MAG: hypothetical protein UT69_C0013G0066 [Candidatus Yanofskybacteria bacterium GW2011_GWE1_40_10]KKR41163.1 MAG: hypothetical protein UT75_C0001G0067 [Candidatus Yanofskybacteria bacterium GW2011_GWE2_40_11]KKT15840.1 MAG: hypothetical protein UV97_C0001G0013 [Candidatus Yanofskybacteria bacterium GW2011_GWF2_43_596]KKT53647.1 MAG: hypothetical protein UW46_C0001G0137 [Candidatus Yanofskybacteria bacterium GW2011_GWF1_44_227]
MDLPKNIPLTITQKNRARMTNVAFFLTGWLWNVFSILLSPIVLIYELVKAGRQGPIFILGILMICLAITFSELAYLTNSELLAFGIIYFSCAVVIGGIKLWLEIHG